MPEKKKKELVGIVKSDKMEKTITVSIARRVIHPIYGKVVNRTKTVKAHDEKNESHIGDIVKIIESRPLSRHKRWTLFKIIEQSKQ